MTNLFDKLIALAIYIMLMFINFNLVTLIELLK